MQIKWLRTALRNLDEEITFIAAEDPQAARRTASRILEAIALETQPGPGRPGRVAGTRELVIVDSSFLITYRVNRQTVEILRVFHTSQRLPQRR